MYFYTIKKIKKENGKIQVEEDTVTSFKYLLIFKEKGGG